MNADSKIACLFDWDGTVVDSGHTHEQTWIMLAASRGLPLIDNFFSETFGERNVEIISKILRWSDDPAEVRKMSDWKEAEYRRIVAERGVPVVAGAEDFLKSLGEVGILCAVASSTPRANLDATVAKLGFGRYFGAYSASEDVSRGKPAPDVFLNAAQKLGAKPQNCVVFEDSLAGIQAGVAAGMKTVALTTTNPREFWLSRGADARPDAVIDNFSGLDADFVERIFQKNV